MNTSSQILQSFTEDNYDDLPSCVQDTLGYLSLTESNYDDHPSCVQDTLGYLSFTESNYDDHSSCVQDTLGYLPLVYHNQVQGKYSTNIFEDNCDDSVGVIDDFETCCTADDPFEVQIVNQNYKDCNISDGIYQEPQHCHFW